MAKISEQTREKLRAAKARYWANRTPEQRQEIEFKRRRTVQINRMKAGVMPLHDIIPSCFIDSDFDEGL